MNNMLENKVLVNLYVLSIGKNFEIFIPVNEKVGNITKLLNANLFNAIQSGKNCVLMNTEEGICYELRSPMCPTIITACWTITRVAVC